MLDAGYALLNVNYHGSIGYGRKFVYSLPSHIGKLDVADTHHAVKTTLKDEQFDVDNVVVFGASHGGFLATHLIAQFPVSLKLLLFMFSKLCKCFMTSTNRVLR